ncbi:MAG: DUF1992 domain-containing protein [Deltaproteobacteria bacterium]|nr:MAG: DUF1992 domain-containing protein [Deltaproteobacteria bacterium]
MIRFWRIAEERIEEAMRQGVFENLPGKGKPLVLDDDSHVPEHLRMAYRVLKNAGFAPPEVELRREIAELQQEVEQTEDLNNELRKLKELNFLITKLNTCVSGLCFLISNRSIWKNSSTR